MFPMNGFNFFPTRVAGLRTIGGVVAMLCALAPWSHGAEAPAPGDSAPGFQLQSLDGRPVELAQLTRESPVVLVVLRGFPGYQCPACSRQVNDFVSRAGSFAGKAKVVMVYPGPAPELQARAKEFMENRDWPNGFYFLLDPDYRFTERYGLRWNAKNETAYPSTFIIGQDGRVKYAKVSRSHGGRMKAEDVLGELK